MKKSIKKITVVTLLAGIFLFGAVGYKAAVNTNSEVRTETVTVVAKSGQYGKIRELQAALGIPQTGQWDTLTIAKVASLPCLSTSNSYPQSVTRWIQRRLGCADDGCYGPNTRDAVYSWQCGHGLERDGVAGFQTIQSLALA